MKTTRSLSFIVLAFVVGLGGCGRRDSGEPRQPSAEQPSPEQAEPSEQGQPAAETRVGTPEGEVEQDAAPAPAPRTEPGEAPSRPRAPAVSLAPPAPPSPAPPEPAREQEETPRPAPAPELREAEPPPPPAPPPPPPEPEIIEVSLQEGTVLELELLTALDSSLNRVGDEIEARTISPVYLDGEPVLPRGTYVEGRVTEVAASGRVKGRARLGMAFDRLSTRTGVKPIKTSFVEKEADSSKGKDAKVVGGAAGVGAVVGGIIGGKKGAAIGAAIGGAGGTGVVLATKGEEIRLPVGTQINVRLEESVVI